MFGLNTGFDRRTMLAGAPVKYVVAADECFYGSDDAAPNAAAACTRVVHVVLTQEGCSARSVERENCILSHGSSPCRVSQIERGHNTSEVGGKHAQNTTDSSLWGKTHVQSRRVYHRGHPMHKPIDVYPRHSYNRNHAYTYTVATIDNTAGLG